MDELSYLCIDLKSFYASVECAARGLDPMTTDLVVADPTRGKGTLCLAVSPSLKEKGVKNRCRVYEIPENLTYITAPPRMQLYIDTSAEIYGIYLDFMAKDDIHVYSVDECFLYVAPYLKLYHMNAREFGVILMEEIEKRLHLPATCGIGTNLYLAKVALDITAKHAPDRIGCLDEQQYRDTLWKHLPLTDFWRIGRGTERRLRGYGILTMEDIAHSDPAFLKKLFGVDAEILYDHAWGREPVSMNDVKSYRSSMHSLSSGQVLLRDYNYEDALLIVKEMAALSCLDLVAGKLVTDSLTLFIGYSGELYPPARKSAKMGTQTSSVTMITDAFVRIYREIVNPCLPIRYVGLNFNHVVPEGYEQLQLFLDPEQQLKERAVQQSVLSLQGRYGRSVVQKGMNLLEAGTTKERLNQIGGHRK